MVLKKNTEGYKPCKANHYDVKVTVKDKDVAKVKKIISLFKGDIEDVDSNKYRLKGGGNYSSKELVIYHLFNMYKDHLDKEDEPVVKKAVDTEKGQAHMGEEVELDEKTKI